MPEDILHRKGLMVDQDQDVEYQEVAEAEEALAKLEKILITQTVEEMVYNQILQVQVFTMQEVEQRSQMHRVVTVLKVD